jgi:hypothetical protein
MFTYGDLKIPQRPHIDYSWDVLLLNNRRRRGILIDKGSKGGIKQGFMPYTLHMPLTPEGSYVYIWFRRGLSCPIHIRYGHILCLSGDVVHCGGLPTLPNGLSHTGNAFIFTFLPMLAIFWIILFFVGIMMAFHLPKKICIFQ